MSNIIVWIIVAALIGVIFVGILIIGMAIAESEPVIFPDEWEEEHEPPYFDTGNEYIDGSEDWED